MQKRHEMKQKGNITLSTILKYILNSLLGYAGLNSSSYSETKLYSEHTLQRNGELNNPNILNVSLIGGRNNNNQMDLIYAITRKKKKVNIENQLQVVVLLSNFQLYLAAF
jgi:hypothetical protein